MKLVAKYKLGEPAGLGAKIAQDDISSFARLIQAIPDYSNIGEKEMLDADGVVAAAVGDEKGDVVSERFQAVFPSPQKDTLISALKISR